MYFNISKTYGLFCYWRLRDGQYTRGFVIKRKSQKLFSERYGPTRGLDFGPLYIRGVRQAEG